MIKCKCGLEPDIYSGTTGGMDDREFLDCTCECGRRWTTFEIDDIDNYRKMAYQTYMEVNGGLLSDDE